MSQYLFNIYCYFFALLLCLQLEGMLKYFDTQTKLLSPAHPFECKQCFLFFSLPCRENEAEEELGHMIRECECECLGNVQISFAFLSVIFLTSQ